MNTGVFLLKPRLFLYEEGLRVLLNCKWTNRTGFDGSGDPVALATDPLQLERLAAGMGGVEKARKKMQMTAFFKERSWLFVGGNIDQGEQPAFEHREEGVGGVVTHLTFGHVFGCA